MNPVTEALKWVGYLEKADASLLGVYTANPSKGGFTIFSDIIRHHYRWRVFQGLPWCAVFVHAVYLNALGKEQAAKALGKPHSGVKVMERYLRKHERFFKRGYEPTPGDVIFLSAERNDNISHCGIVIDSSDNTITSVEGNTIDPNGFFSPEEGGAVAIRTRCADDAVIVGFGKLNESVAPPLLP